MAFFGTHERGIAIVKVLRSVGGELPSSRPERRFGGETTMKPIHVREFDRRTRCAETGFSTRAVPSPAGRSAAPRVRPLRAGLEKLPGIHGFSHGLNPWRLEARKLSCHIFISYRRQGRVQHEPDACRKPRLDVVSARGKSDATEHRKSKSETMEPLEAERRQKEEHRGLKKVGRPVY
jgi:hypothetical protein